MKAKIISLCFAFLALMNAHIAQALEYTLHENNNSKTLTAIFATGVIEEGDTERLGSYLRKLPFKNSAVVYLGSPGGNLYEGMTLGLLFRKNRIKTVVEGGYDCASACALAFLGGTDNEGRPWRSSYSNCRLGFHAFRGISGRAINEDEVQRTVADMLRYGKAVNAPIDLLIAGFSTSSRDIFWVSQTDICALGIQLWSNATNQFVCNK